MEAEFGGVVGVAGREGALGERAAVGVGGPREEVGGREAFRGGDTRPNLSRETGVGGVAFGEKQAWRRGRVELVRRGDGVSPGPRRHPSDPPLRSLSSKVERRAPRPVRVCDFESWTRLAHGRVLPKATRTMFFWSTGTQDDT